MTKISSELKVKLKSQLPHGAIKEISQSLGVSIQHVSKTLSGKGGDDIEIIKKAIEIIERHKAETAKLNKKLEEMLNAIN